MKDPASKLCYKALAKLHETFGLLGESVQEIGNTGNATRDLQVQPPGLCPCYGVGDVMRIESLLAESLIVGVSWLQTRTDELALRNTAEAIERMGADLKELKEQNSQLSAK